MSLITVRTILGWCFALNYAILLVWFLYFIFAHDSMYRYHVKRFKLSVESFDTIHYAALGFYKILIIVFVVAPYVALHLAR